MAAINLAYCRPRPAIGIGAPVVAGLRFTLGFACAVLRDGPAITGAGAGCILIAAPEGDAPRACAGLHTELGEAIGAAFYDAT